MILQAASDYAEMGWRVIPIYGLVDGRCTCTRYEGSACSPGKHPIIGNWQEKASTDPEQIHKWFETWPNSNVGIVTGVESALICRCRWCR